LPDAEREEKRRTLQIKWGGKCALESQRYQPNVEGIVISKRVPKRGQQDYGRKGDTKRGPTRVKKGHSGVNWRKSNEASTY